jgi:hypothetical protein
MRNSVAEIREIELQIQRIAINATIRAAHLDRAGNALNTIADAMQRLVLDSSSNTGEASQTLDSMQAAAHSVWSESAVPSLMPDTRDVVEEMRIAVLDLHSSSEHSFERVNQIAASGSELGDDIRSVLDGFTAGQLFVGTITRARAELQSIAADSGPAPLEECDDSSPGGLESFSTHYTMQVERDVHRLAAGHAALSQPGSTGLFNTPPDDESLGENVELF